MLPINKPLPMRLPTINVNGLDSSPYLVNRDILYIGYDFVIGTSIADMNLSDLMVVKA